MERLKDLSALEWLTAQKQYWWCGFDVDVGERSTWILHAMYEDAGLPGGLSHDDAYRIPRAADPPEPSVGFGRVTSGSNSMPPRSSAVRAASPLGRDRIGDVFPGASVRADSASTCSPRYGSRITARSHIAAGRPTSGRQPKARSTVSSIDGCWSGSPHTHPMGTTRPALPSTRAAGLAACRSCSAGRLRAALERYDDPAQRGGPNNLWPEDRSWFVYSDYDLWGTRIGGLRQAA